MSRFFLALLLAAVPLLAQSSQPTIYAVVTYFDVPAENAAAYRTHVTTMSKQFYQEMMKSNPNMRHWSLAQILYPGENPKYNYVGVVGYSGPPPEPGGTAAEAAAKKVAGVSLAEYLKKVNSMRKMVGSELLVRNSGTAAPGPGVSKEGDIRSTLRLRVKPGMNEAYMGRSTGMTLPMMQARVAAGEIKSWSNWSKRSPWGGEDSYSHLSSTTFKDLASALKTFDSAAAAAMFSKILPGKNYANYVSGAREYSDIVDGTLSQVIAQVEQ